MWMGSAASAVELRVIAIITGDQKRLQLVGPLPVAVQNNTAYSAAVMTGGNTVAAEDFIRYLTTPEAKQTFSAAGVD